MFVAHLDKDHSWAPILVHPILRASMAWLKQNALSSDEGDYELGKSNWYANVHGYQTLPKPECSWENHKHTIDIQYIISGREQILWANVDVLGPARRYLEEKDREEFILHNGTFSSLVMSPGMFAVFLPGDAHCPKISLDEAEYIKKVVVKIPSLLIN
jgi:YhcH/YjgK/YiaL family protein